MMVLPIMGDSNLNEASDGVDPLDTYFGEDDIVRYEDDYDRNKINE